MSSARTEPDWVLIAGGEKCASTTLHQLLGSRCNLKTHESHEFSMFVNDSEFSKGLDANLRTYRVQPQRGVPVLLKSVGLLHVPGAAERAAATLPGQVLVVVQLRNPMDRAVSAARYQIQTGRETRSIDEALRSDGSAPLDYVHRSRYVDDLARLFSVFGRDRVLVRTLEGDGINDAEVDALALELSLRLRSVQRASVTRANTTHGNSGLLRFRSQLKVLSPLFRWVPVPAKRVMFERLGRVGTGVESGYPSSSTLEVLAERLAGSVTEVEELLGQDLKEWC